MPYRNALRDNFRRFMDVNDAEMRQYAKDYSQRYRPQGQYAAADDLGMDEIGFDDQGNAYIIGSEQDPNYGQQMQPPVYEEPTEQPQDGYNPESGFGAILNRKRAIQEALKAQ